MSREWVRMFPQYVWIKGTTVDEELNSISDV